MNTQAATATQPRSTVHIGKHVLMPLESNLAFNQQVFTAEELRLAAGSEADDFFSETPWKDILEAVPHLETIVYKRDPDVQNGIMIQRYKYDSRIQKPVYSGHPDRWCYALCLPRKR